MTTRPAVFLEPVELLVEIVSSEPLTERVEDVISAFSGVVNRASSLRNTAASSRAGPTSPDGGERRRSVDRHPAFASMTPVRNPMDEMCPSPIPRTLITNRRLPVAIPVWSG